VAALTGKGFAAKAPSNATTPRSPAAELAAVPRDTFTWPKAPPMHPMPNSNVIEFLLRRQELETSLPMLGQGSPNLH